MKDMLIIVLLWNSFTFLLMGIDKYKAIKNKRRISERVLLITAFAIGGIGSFVGSLFFRHKTKKTRFRVLLPLSVLCSLAMIYSLSIQMMK